MKLIRYTSLLSAMLLAGGLAFAADKPVTVKLEAQGGSGQNGTATLTPEGEKTRIVFKLDGGAGAAQPAHIHEGTCAKLDPKPKYPLENVVKGASTTVVGVGLDKIMAGHACDQRAQERRGPEDLRRLRRLEEQELALPLRSVRPASTPAFCRRLCTRRRRHVVRSRHHDLPDLRHAMRLLHTMLRVGNLQRSIDFYSQVLGMKVLRTTERPEQKYTLAFMGYGSNPEHAEIELTYNYGVDRYELGSAYGHIAIGVADVAATCTAVRDKAAALGGAVTREAGPVKGGTTVIAFITDPDGYKIELIQRDA